MLKARQQRIDFSKPTEDVYSYKMCTATSLYGSFNLNNLGGAQQPTIMNKSFSALMILFLRESDVDSAIRQSLMIFKGQKLLQSFKSSFSLRLSNINQVPKPSQASLSNDLIIVFVPHCTCNVTADIIEKKCSWIGTLVVMMCLGKSSNLNHDMSIGSVYLTCIYVTSILNLHVILQLWELKNDRYEGVSSLQVTERLDKYQELLGRRENFLLHATVAILSFLIFGLLPPVIYGFSFRESNNRDFKLIAVAVASLLCVTVLATGKAYIQRPLKAYIKTVMYYVIIRFMASCVSYAVGDLIKELLEKHGFNSGDLALTLPILEATSKQPAWESY